MQQDTLGLNLSTQSQDAATAYDAALTDFMEHRLSTSAHIKKSLEADPEFVMGLCFRGYVLMQLGSIAIYDKVESVVQQLKSIAQDATQREREHIQALEFWLAGRVSESCKIWQDILVHTPHDLLALRLHHFMSFWQGHREDLRSLPASVLGQIDESTPGYSYVLGMFAFGLEECGDYQRAEECGRKAVAMNKEDLWALHSIAHVLEMQGRFDDGLTLLDQPFGIWQDRNPFKDHVWWHTALFALERDEHDRVLDFYDREVRIDEIGFYLDFQNAASLLMRLELHGVDVGERWTELADMAETRKEDHVMPFTDMHFMLALAGAKRTQSGNDYITSLEDFSSRKDNDAAQVTAALGLPIARFLQDYAEGNFNNAVDTLLPIRHDLAPLGGSHAQQDILNQMLIDATMRHGRVDLARSLLTERAVLKPNSKWAHRQLEKLV